MAYYQCHLEDIEFLEFNLSRSFFDFFILSYVQHCSLGKCDSRLFYMLFYK